MPRVYVRTPLAERFMAKIDKRGPEECWEWQACRMAPWGYGQIAENAEGRVILAHRAAWLILVGPIPEGLFVLHHCDNPPCCNPAHLFLGTVADNTADMDRKGRRRSVQKCGDEHWTRQHPERVPRGTASFHAKLTAEQVAEVRRRYAAGGILQRELAVEFGTSQVQISRVIRGVTYA